MAKRKPRSLAPAHRGRAAKQRGAHRSGGVEPARQSSHAGSLRRERPALLPFGSSAANALSLPLFSPAVPAQIEHRGNVRPLAFIAEAMVDEGFLTACTGNVAADVERAVAEWARDKCIGPTEHLTLAYAPPRRPGV